MWVTALFSSSFSHTSNSFCASAIQSADALIIRAQLASRQSEGPVADDVIPPPAESSDLWACVEQPHKQLEPRRCSPGKHEQRPQVEVEVLTWIDCRSNLMFAQTLAVLPELHRLRLLRTNTLYLPKCFATARRSRTGASKSQAVLHEKQLPFRLVPGELRVEA